MLSLGKPEILRINFVFCLNINNITNGSDVNKCTIRKSGFSFFNNLTNGKKLKKNR